MQDKEMGIGDFVIDAYAEYGRATNLSRHVPVLEDGLKPVYKKTILAALDVASNKKVKTATVVGRTIGCYSPHGDCLRGNTLVVTNDSQIRTIKELYELSKSGVQTEFEVMVVTEDNSIQRGVIHDIRVGQRTDIMYDIEINRRYHIQVTSNHPFQVYSMTGYSKLSRFGAKKSIDKTRTPGWVKAEDLKEGMTLVGGRYTNYNTMGVKLFGSPYEDLYHAINDGRSECTHHIDHNRHNNLISNLMFISDHEHRAIHGTDSVHNLHARMHVKGNFLSDRKSVRDSLIMKNNNILQSYRKALKVLDYLFNLGLPLTEEHYSLNSKFVGKGVPRLDTLYSKGIITNFSQLLELYKKHPKGTYQLADCLGIELPYRGKCNQDIYPDDLKYPINEREVHKRIPTGCISDREFRDLYYQVLKDDMSNLESLYEKLSYLRVTKVTKIKLDDFEDFYDFTEDSRNSMLVPLVNNDQDSPVISIHNSSVVPVVSELVHAGIFIGQGSFGSKAMFRANDTGPAAMRYTEVMVNPKWKEMVGKLLPYVPTHKNDLDNWEPDFLPVPYVVSLALGSFGIGLGLTVNLPAFSAQSLIKAGYAAILKKDKPWLLLEPNYGLSMSDEDKKTFWFNQSGKLTYNFSVTPGFSGGLNGWYISGDPSFVKPKWGELFKARSDGGKVLIRDESAKGVNKVFIARSKRVKTITDSEVEDMVYRAASVTKFFSLYTVYKNQTRPITGGDWIQMTMMNYNSVVHRYKTDQIAKLDLDIEAFSHFREIADRILNTSDSYPKIRKDLGLSSNEVVERVAGMSINTLRTADVTKRLKSLNEKRDYFTKLTTGDMLKEFL